MEHYTLVTTDPLLYRAFSQHCDIRFAQANFTSTNLLNRKRTLIMIPYYTVWKCFCFFRRVYVKYCV